MNDKSISELTLASEDLRFILKLQMQKGTYRKDFLFFRVAVAGDALSAVTIGLESYTFRMIFIAEEYFMNS